MRTRLLCGDDTFAASMRALNGAAHSNDDILAAAYAHLHALLKSWERLPAGGEIILRFKVDEDGCAHKKVNLNNRVIDCSLPVCVPKCC